MHADQQHNRGLRLRTSRGRDAYFKHRLLDLSRSAMRLLRVLPGTGVIHCDVRYTAKMPTLYSPILRLGRTRASVKHQDQWRIVHSPAESVGFFDGDAISWKIGLVLG